MKSRHYIGVDTSQGFDETGIVVLRDNGDGSITLVEDECDSVTYRDVLAKFRDLSDRYPGARWSWLGPGCPAENGVP